MTYYKTSITCRSYICRLFNFITKPKKENVTHWLSLSCLTDFFLKLSCLISFGNFLSGSFYSFSFSRKLVSFNGFTKNEQAFCYHKSKSKTKKKSNAKLKIILTSLKRLKKITYNDLRFFLLIFVTKTKLYLNESNFCKYLRIFFLKLAFCTFADLKNNFI